MSAQGRENQDAHFKHFGWTRRPRANCCPRVVVGKRCKAPIHSHGSDECLCSKFYALFDHGVVWRDADGRMVLTGEPYDRVDSDQLTALVATAAADGVHLVVHVAGYSPWYPGRTILIVVRAASE